MVWTVKQTAQVLQYSERRMLDLVQAGAIPGARKIGGQWRISARSVWAWIDGWDTEAPEDVAPGADRT